MNDTPKVVPLISQLEAKQISEEVSLCLGNGISSWQILKALRFIRETVREGRTFTIEKGPPCDNDGSSGKA